MTVHAPDCLAGGVVEFSNDFSFYRFCSSWGSSTSPTAYGSLLIPIEPAGDPEGADPSDGHLLASLFLQTTLLTARAAAAATGPTVTLGHPLLGTCRIYTPCMNFYTWSDLLTLQAKLLKGVIFIFNIGLEGK